MDGIHDLGGMQGFGPVERDEAVFHAPWERLAFAMAQTVPRSVCASGVCSP